MLPVSAMPANAPVTLSRSDPRAARRSTARRFDHCTPSSPGATTIDSPRSCSSTWRSTTPETSARVDTLEIRAWTASALRTKRSTGSSPRAGLRFGAGTEEIDEAGDEQPDPGAAGRVVGRLPDSVGHDGGYAAGCRPILSEPVESSAGKKWRRRLD